MHDVRVIDEERRTVYRGDVDLGPTLERIERGVRLRFSHDGIVFENRKRRLPPKASGYYHEFVQPTPGDDGPGGQRVVLGRDGEVYYSADHYRSFRRVR
jgi:guanyl-specific ribonuclease Sa